MVHTVHNHPLSDVKNCYQILGMRDIPLKWMCDRCHTTTINADEPRYRCISGCDYDLCMACVYPPCWIPDASIYPESSRLLLSRPVGHRISGYHDIAVSHNGLRVACSGNDNVIYLWDLDHPRDAPQALYGHFDAVHCLLFSFDGSFLISGLLWKS
jgi:WD40 repeat protein